MATITVEGWQAIGAVIGLVLTAIFKFVLDVLRDRREREAARERLQVLRDIAASNAQMREGQIAQNGKLTLAVSLNDIRHKELINALNSVCKAKPIFPQQQDKQT